MIRRLSHALFVLFLFAPSVSLAQDFVATGDSHSIAISGVESIGEAGDWAIMELSNSDGSSTLEELVVLNNQLLLRLNPQSESFSIVSAKITSTQSTTQFGIVVFVDDKDTLGEDWEPWDINDPNNWNGCEDVAEEIQDELGDHAVIVHIRPKAPASFLPPFMGVTQTPAWHNHCVVIKRCHVYDAFGPPEGIP